MPLRLNLYHEVQKAERLKRRDPLKISAYGLAAIAAFGALYYFAELVKMHGINDDLARTKRDFDKIEPAAKAAKKRQDELEARAKASEQLVKRIEGRFYWAPLLAQIAQVVPRDVQITWMGADISGEGVRKCSITVDGLSAGADPRHVAEDLRTAIAEKFSPTFKNVTSVFKSLEDGAELVMLDGKQVPTATFAINVQLYTGEEKVAPTTRAKT